MSLVALALALAGCPSTSTAPAGPASPEPDLALSVPTPAVALPANWPAEVPTVEGTLTVATSNPAPTPGQRDCMAAWTTHLTRQAVVDTFAALEGKGWKRGGFLDESPTTTAYWVSPDQKRSVTMTASPDIAEPTRNDVVVAIVTLP